MEDSNVELNEWWELVKHNLEKKKVEEFGCT
jgi:hypothetical protein